MIVTKVRASGKFLMRMGKLLCRCVCTLVGGPTCPDCQTADDCATCGDCTPFYRLLTADAVKLYPESTAASTGLGTVYFRYSGAWFDPMTCTYSGSVIAHQAYADSATSLNLCNWWSPKTVFPGVPDTSDTALLDELDSYLHVRAYSTLEDAEGDTGENLVFESRFIQARLTNNSGYNSIALEAWDAGATTRFTVFGTAGILPDLDHYITSCNDTDTVPNAQTSADTPNHIIGFDGTQTVTPCPPLP